MEDLLPIVSTMPVNILKCGEMGMVCFRTAFNRYVCRMNFNLYSIIMRPSMTLGLQLKALSRLSTCYQLFSMSKGRQ